MNHLKIAAASISLANLFLLRSWHELLFAPPERQFYLSSPESVNLVAAVLNTLLLGAAFYCLVLFFKKTCSPTYHKLISLFLLLSLAAPLNFFRLMVPGLTFARLAAIFGDYGFLLLLGLIAAGLIYIALRWHQKFIAITGVVLLILSPFVILTFSQALWKAATYQPPDKPENTPYQEGAPETRVLWLIFDELDQRLTFDDRPEGVNTPALDKFKKQSVYATRAQAPGKETVISMPALISGLPVVEADPVSKSELMLYLEGSSEPIPWSQQGNIFSKAHSLGYNTGLVGCYLPYNRVIGHTLTESKWQPFGTVEINDNQHLPGTMLNQFLASFSFSPFNQRRHAVQVHTSLLEDGKKMAADPKLGLVLIHFTIPHYPWIYDRAAEDFTYFNYNMEKGYYDNLALVDKTLNELRLTMEKTGTWENTHIIISSDHPWRMELFPAFDSKEKPYIPFLLRLANQEEKITYQEPFNTAITKDLILDLLEKKISSPDEAVTWLGENSSDAECF